MRIEYYTKDMRLIRKEVLEACEDVEEIKISPQFLLLYK